MAATRGTFEGILSREQTVRLFDEGFVTIPNFTSLEDVNLIRELLDEAFDRWHYLPKRVVKDLGNRDKSGEPTVPEINGAVSLIPALKHTLFYRRCMSAARELFGRRADYIFDHAIYKQPGSSVAWHQDEVYSRAHNSNRIHCWLPLQATDSHNGCMVYVPGSHLGPLLPHLPRGDDERSHALEASHVAMSEAVTHPVALGGANLHLHRTLHCSTPNHSSQISGAWIVHMGIPAHRRRLIRTLKAVRARLLRTR